MVSDYTKMSQMKLIPRAPQMKSLCILLLLSIDFDDPILRFQKEKNWCLG